MAEIYVTSRVTAPRRSSSIGTTQPATSRFFAARTARSGRASISSTRRLPLANMSPTARGSTTWKRLLRSSAVAIKYGTRRRSEPVAVMSNTGATAIRMRPRVMRAPSSGTGRGLSGAGTKVATENSGCTRRTCAQPSSSSYRPSGRPVSGCMNVVPLR